MAAILHRWELRYHTGPKKFAQNLRILLPFHKPDAVESAASGKNG